MSDNAALDRVYQGPTSDERGWWQAAAQSWVYSWERSLPPWRRGWKRSNGRLMRTVKNIRAIRGIHKRTVSLRRTPQW